MRLIACHSAQAHSGRRSASQHPSLWLESRTYRLRRPARPRALRQAQGERRRGRGTRPCSKSSLHPNGPSTGSGRTEAWYAPLSIEVFSSSQWPFDKLKANGGVEILLSFHCLSTSSRRTEAWYRSKSSLHPNCPFDKLEANGGTLRVLAKRIVPDHPTCLATYSRRMGSTAIRLTSGFALYYHRERRRPATEAIV